MLIITRRPGEKVMLGEDIVVEILEVSGSTVRIGIAAPKAIPVYREEIYQPVKAENQASATSKAKLPDNVSPRRRATPAVRRRRRTDQQRPSRSSPS